VVGPPPGRLGHTELARYGASASSPSDPGRRDREPAP
jgi:hypothetical protein